MFFNACKKDPVVKPPVVVSTEDPKKLRISKKVDSIKESLIRQNFQVTSFELNKDSTAVIFSYENTTTGAAEFGILRGSNSGDYFYGFPIHGRNLLETGELMYFNPNVPKNDKQPVLIKGGNGEILNKSVTKLALSSMRVQIAQVRESLGGIEGLRNKKGEIKYSISTFNKYDDIKNDVLFNTSKYGLRNNMDSKEIPDIRNFVPDNQPIGFISGVYLFCRQDSYVALLDDGSADWKMYEKEIDPSLFVNNTPAYISEVTFGRYALLTVESSLFPNDQIKEALNAALKDTASMTEIQKKIVNTSTIRTYYSGSNFLPIGTGMQSLSDFLLIAKNNIPNYLQGSDEPTYFKVKSLKDKKILTGGKYTYSQKFDLK
ncbi:hypothetical protein TH53_07485 [Pedobacter lusitanus]|uniref:Thiol-activated cytolysin n=1 Tax=Pedobacter lusitanus TaxID=1503925 RepID=A0A0D0FZ09_9SPHI|nr:hypothetical protein TH53_07485 [Pedobacter lusitanus]